MSERETNELIRKLTNVVLSRLRVPRHQQEDVGQIVALTVLQCLKNCDERKKVPSARYVHIAARQAALRYLIKEQGQPAGLMVDPSEGDGVEVNEGLDGLGQWFDRAGLTEAERELLVLRYTDGLTLKEIAGQTDTALRTVHGRLNRAEAKLRSTHVG